MSTVGGVLLGSPMAQWLKAEMVSFCVLALEGEAEGRRGREGKVVRVAGEEEG